jgi:hypothetical protein
MFQVSVNDTYLISVTIAGHYTRDFVGYFGHQKLGRLVGEISIMKCSLTRLSWNGPRETGGVARPIRK